MSRLPDKLFLMALKHYPSAVAREALRARESEARLLEVLRHVSTGDFGGAGILAINEVLAEVQLYSGHALEAGLSASVASGGGSSGL